MNSDPAFPVWTSDATHGHQDGDDTWQFPGMSIRDYFAAKAMGNMISAWRATKTVDPTEYPLIARHAFLMADAMLEEREATPALKPTQPAPFPTPDSGNRPFGYFWDAGGPL